MRAVIISITDSDNAEWRGGELQYLKRRWCILVKSAVYVWSTPRFIWAEAILALEETMSFLTNLNILLSAFLPLYQRSPNPSPDRLRVEFFHLHPMKIKKSYHSQPSVIFWKAATHSDPVMWETCTFRSSFYFSAFQTGRQLGFSLSGILIFGLEAFKTAKISLIFK